ncbi:unnamed protein product (mitochondrion) [Plasmodiophora brassicae]|uniref:Cytochrome b561 domain-containing protein n=1 Tax=Plasmodiophora brassicae TaxID=37360 RepID=A0A3P3YJ60_PLABS|nr:unnamed protein product [Plasmodiophora brassicae]
MGWAVPLRSWSLTLGSTAIVALTAWWLHSGLGGWSTRSGDVYFNWHILLGVVAIATCLQASAAFRTYTDTVSRPTRKSIHWVGNAICLVSMAAAVKVAFEVHEDKGKRDLTSVHSWIGFATLIFMAGGPFLAGALAFLMDVFPKHIRAAVVPVHSYFGSVALYPSAIVTGNVIAVAIIVTTAIAALPPLHTKRHTD